MKYLSVCSGIEAASVAWQPLGWEPVAFSEIEPFPRSVLAHHYPNVPNLGDMRGIVRLLLTGEVEAADVLCGGTPCQAFSVAGKRESLADERGNLSLVFVEIADAIDHVRVAGGKQPSIVIWENVPGVLNTRDNAFGCFLGALSGAGCELQPAGKKWTDAGCVHGPARAVAWRVLDAQYFGLAQRRRRRVFVVASARKGFDPAAVLFESEGRRRDTPPRREARQEATADFAGRTGTSGIPIPPTPIVGQCISAKWAKGSSGPAGDEHHNLIPVMSVHGSQDPDTATEYAHPIGRNNGMENTVFAANSVRKITPLECERLMGFPDGYTDVFHIIRPACGSERYRALGNSWAVNVARWIGERIAAVDAITNETRSSA